MPAKSKAQFRFFEAAAHSRKIAKKLGVSQKTAKEFVSKTSSARLKKLPQRVKK